MRTILPSEIDRARIQNGPFASKQGSGPNGAFRFVGATREILIIIASDGTEPIAENWEHVSASFEKRCPTWKEMAWVKDAFWLPEETVVQFHPPKSVHVNFHPNCLHLWRHRTLKFPMPPTILLGPLNQMEKPNE